VQKVEKSPTSSEEKKTNEEETLEDGRGKMNEWLSENLRMVVSVVIVVLIAGGIYAYSKRVQAPAEKKKAAATTEESSEGKISVIGGENGQTVSDESAKDQAQSNSEEQVSKPQTVSQETENSFVETAAKGDGATQLARRALANYLEKNPDSALTAEHKIYIEDYLRRQVKDGRLNVGDKREFAKDMIANAIQKSKGLNEKQLKNLQKYSQKVPSLK